MMLNSTTILYIVAAVIVVAVFAISLMAARRRVRPRKLRIDPYVGALRSLVDGDREKAFSSFQQSIKSGKAPTDAYIRLGRLLRENGDPNKALQIHKNLTVKPDLARSEKVELFVNIAQDYSKLGNSAQAVNILETAIKQLGLREAAVYGMLSKEYHVLGKPADAYRCLKEMKRTDGVGERELSLYLCTAGEQKAEEGDLKEARKLFQRALKHDPKCATACYWLGNLEEKLGNENGALEQWKKAALISPELSGEALKNLERMMFQRGTFGDIERVYRDVVEARPWDEYATLALASFYKKQGRGEEAIEFLEEFRNMHPESIGTTSLLTTLYATHRNQDDLEKFLDDNETEAAARSTHYSCADCGFQSATMRWHCQRCNAFDTFSKKNEV